MHNRESLRVGVDNVGGDSNGGGVVDVDASGRGDAYTSGSGWSFVSDRCGRVDGRSGGKLVS